MHVNAFAFGFPCYFCGCNFVWVITLNRRSGWAWRRDPEALGSYADWCMHVMSQDMHFVFFCVTPRISREARSLASWKFVEERWIGCGRTQQVSLFRCCRAAISTPQSSDSFHVRRDALAAVDPFDNTHFYAISLLDTGYSDTFMSLSLSLCARWVLVLPHCFSSLCCNVSPTLC